jgi:hypothetical protein
MASTWPPPWVTTHDALLADSGGRIARIIQQETAAALPSS